MPEQIYIRPPIVQALFEARFDTPCDIKKTQKFIKNVSDHYPSTEEGKSVNVHIDEKADVTTKASIAGYKLSSLEGTDLILIQPSTLAVGRLAPYEGWDSFSSTLKKVWKEEKNVFGYRQINRLALRYINRIDIPCEKNGVIEESDYVNISIGVPKDTVPLFNGYRIEFTSKIGSDVWYTIRTGVSASPIIDHMAIVLDLDIYKDTDLPQKDDDIWDFLTELRIQKNNLFESFITEKSRELFNRNI